LDNEKDLGKNWYDQVGYNIRYAWAAGIYDDKIIISVGDYAGASSKYSWFGERDTIGVYLYDINKNTLKKVVSGYVAGETYGKYVELRNVSSYINEDVGDVRATKKFGVITSSGIKVKKTFTKCGLYSAFISGNYYYVTYPKSKVNKKDQGVDGMALNQVAIYRYNPKSNSSTKIATIKSSNNYRLTVCKITSKYCLYVEYDGDYNHFYTWYKYNFSTKTKTKLETEEFSKLGGVVYFD
jgi:hypothetical protein